MTKKRSSEMLVVERYNFKEKLGKINNIFPDSKIFGKEGKI